MPQFRFLSTMPLMLVALAPLGANAQEINPLVRERIVVQGNSGNAESRERQVRVQASINVFMPGPSGDGEAAEQLRERARRMIYQVASRECGVLEEVLARTCRLEAIASTPGIDGLFLGPVDMSLTLSGGKSLDADAPDVDRVLERIIKATKDTGKIAGTYCFEAEQAAAFEKRGVRFFLIGSDTAFLRGGTSAALKALRR